MLYSKTEVKMNYQTDKESNLKYIEFFNDPDFPYIVLLHGYGANAKDLASIAKISEFAALKYNWIFPEALLSPAELQSINGKAWFEVDIAHFQSLVLQNKFDEYYSRSPENIDFIHDSLEIFFKNKKLTEKNMILGGFSQGAMVATDHLYEKKIRPLALLYLSGTVIREGLWKSQSLENLKIFQTHGRFDDVLPVQGALHFKEIAQSKDHKLHVFEGGHEIPPQILFELYTFLKVVNNL